MKILHAFRRDEKGNVAINFGILVVPLLMSAGAALDYSYAALQRTTMQRAADAAALAGARALGAEVTVVEQEAKRFFVAHDGPQVTPSITVSTEAVTVEATYSQPTFLMNLAGQEHVTIKVRAVAGRGKPAVPCVLALEPTEKQAIALNSGSKLNADCGVQTNSASSEALYASSHSWIKSEELCAKGGWNIGNDSAFNPKPKKCERYDDPLADLPTPSEASGACSKIDMKIDKQNVTLNPGVYCNDLTISGDSVVTLNPGIYVIRDGLLKITSGSTVKGSDVLLFFIGTNARLEMESKSALETTASSSGPYADIVIYQNRANTSDPFVINSHGRSGIVGTVYIPKSDLKMNSDAGVTSASTYFAIIARRVEFNSNATFVIKNKDYQPKQSLLRSKAVALVK
jgi:Flp pilus assembly protein TadG